MIIFHGWGNDSFFQGEDCGGFWWVIHRVNRVWMGKGVDKGGFCCLFQRVAFLCNSSLVRGRSFRLGEKNQKPPGGAELSLLRNAPGPPYPPWGSGSIGVSPPASSRGRPGTLWSSCWLWAPIARHWLALCARVCCSGCGTCLLCVDAACGRSQIAPTGAQKSNLIRVAARPYSRRDPCSETTWPGISERESRGSKTLWWG